MSGLTTCQEQLSPAAWAELRADALRDGFCLAGFHNHNYLLSGSGGSATLAALGVDTPVKVRVGRRDAMKVVERPWPDEGAVLRALREAGAVRNLPRYFAGIPDTSVHEFIPGTTLAAVCPPGKPVDTIHVENLVAQMAEFTRVPADILPPMPKGWAADGDSRTFLRDRAEIADREVRAAHWGDLGSLFAALEVPANALRLLRRRIPALRPRPFSLVHGDLHRHNVIVRDDGAGLTLVDWELAMWGDPLYDLAIHLVRMRYPAEQRWEVVERWRAAVRPEAAEGLNRDLPVYLTYERAQSLFADTIRAARGLGAHPVPGAVGSAVSRVRNALHLAAGPLHLNRVPSRTEVERALLAWARVHGGRGPSADV
ncbi:aminoglycoside phosphotransferase family protein [Actinacidiphila rubida]|uniref:Phosphotransferase enzyme family protein n=1 Tax=Actinacidiphila rubida TaxID=310780 RepID=A0A1H8P3I8_9ACTN|nr:aminoglycoside phosphotransferase family protein [Actinacidiphila rubida]SEO36490.1 Phosphotransferase enzyme family protein [Actinacidiphila rubida]